jgi:hypothetical protein
MLAVHIASENDTNGNPRRGWFIADDNGDYVDFVDEGYMGSGALAEAGYPDITKTSAKISVKPSVYREAIQALEDISGQAQRRKRR